jgi:hypothetical protein
MKQRLRVVSLLLMSISAFTFVPGCALFKEPTKIETPEDFLRLPRVSTSKEKDKKALKSSEMAARQKGYR